jgi:hypothetical protein
MFLRSGFILVITLFAMTFIAPAANAAIFSNQYVSFELPPNWSCKNDGTEWICISQLEKNSKEAIIILTAKEAGPTDTLEAYTAHLSSPRILPDITGKPTPSQKLSVKQRLINGQPWVDGMHLGSEIASYYTRYLATIKDRLAIAVTFSAHKTHYTKYSQDFLKSIESLRVTASKDMFKSPNQRDAKGGEERIGNEQADPFPMMGSPLPPEPNARQKNYLRYGLGLLLIIAAVAIYLMRKK